MASNTLAAFALAARKGADMIETDARMTRDGVLIAIVARRKVQYVPFAALFLSYLRIGADIMSRNSDIPFEIVNIIQAVMVLLISATAILSGYKKKLIIKETKEFEAAAKKEVQA